MEFAGARPIDEYYEEQRKNGVSYMKASEQLVMEDVRLFPFGNWLLFRDAQGNLWEKYSSIGD